MNWFLFCIKGNTRRNIESSIETLLKGSLEKLSLPAKKNGRLTLSVAAENRDDLNYKLGIALKQLKYTDSISDPSGIYFESSPFGKNSLAFLFPGQGSQYLKMLSPMTNYLPGFKEELENAFSTWQSIDTRDLYQLINSDSSTDAKEKLNDTFNAQPAIGIMSDALSSVLMKYGIKPRFLAGHSYGELCALKAAGTFSRKTFLYLSRERGRLLSEAGSIAPGCMTAVISSAQNIEPWLEAIHGTIEIANYNNSSQIVVAGEIPAVEALEQKCRENKIKTIRLKTSCAFHSSLMAPVSDKWAKILRTNKNHFFDLDSSLNTVVYSNYTSLPYQKNEYIENLHNQIENPVRWESLLKDMHKKGARIFIETGPGNVLTGLTKKILDGEAFFASNTDLKSQKKTMCLMARLAAHNIPLNWNKYFSHSPLYNKEPNQKVINLSDLKNQRDTAMKEQKQNGAAMKNNSYIKSSSYFEGNSNVVQSFFNLQEVLIEKLLPSVPSDRLSGIVDNMLKKNIDIVQNFLKAQNHGVKNFDSENFPSGLDLSVNTKASSQVNKSEPKTPNVPIKRGIANDDSQSKNICKNENIADEIVLWTKKEICRQTGFPDDYITEDLAFTDELGLDSLTLMQLLLSVMNKYPVIETIGDKLREAVSLGTLHDILSKELVNEIEEQHEITQTNHLPGQENRQAEGDSRSNQLTESDLTQPYEMPAEMTELKDIEKWLLLKFSMNAIKNANTINVDSHFFFDLGLDIFNTEKILKELEQVIPKISVAGYELLRCNTVNDLTGIIKKILPGNGHKTFQNVGLTERFVIVEKEDKLSPDPHQFKLPKRIILAGSSGLYYKKFLNFLEENDCEVIQLHQDKYRGDNGWVDVKNNKFIKFEDTTKLSSTLQQYKSTHSIPPVIIVEKMDRNHLESDNFQKWQESLEASATAAFVLAKALIDKKQETKIEGELFAYINCGKNYPAMRATAGIVKSLSREWPKVNVKYARLTDTPGNEGIKNLFSELYKNGDPGKELIIDGKKIKKVKYASEALIHENDRKINISPHSNILLTGGGDGITSELGLSLAKNYQCHIICLGRTELSETYRSYFQFTDDTELKKQIYYDIKKNDSIYDPYDVLRIFKIVKRQQAIKNTKKRILNAGGTFSYYRTDVTDKDQLEATILKIKAGVGDINGFIHGAGITDDKMVSAKSLSSFRNVLSTKAHSIYYLYHLLKKEPLEFAVFLSSVSSFTGTIGQTDYAAANEILNGTASVWNQEAKYPVKSMLWTVWKETGLAGDALKKEMEKYGLGTISTKEGVKLFLDELANGKKSESIVMFSPYSTLDFLDNFSQLQVG